MTILSAVPNKEKVESMNPAGLLKKEKRKKLCQLH
jgi:hypothetical protein